MLAGPVTPIIPFLSALVSTTGVSAYKEAFPLAVSLLSNLASCPLGAQTLVETNCIPEMVGKICNLSLKSPDSLEESLEVAETLECALLIGIMN